MKSLVSLLLTVASLVVISLFGFVTLSLFMVVAAALSLSLFARGMMGQAQVRPAHARADHPRAGHTDRVKRVWNDGRGTIIDM